MIEWGVECNGWGRRHIEHHTSRESAEKRVAALGGFGDPVLVWREVSTWTKASR